jgi:hypothetical protein
MIAEQDLCTVMNVQQLGVVLASESIPLTLW